MTMQPKEFEQIPEETDKVARAAFPKGNVYMKLRDELNTIYKDEEFADLFPQVGQTAESPGRLALVTVLQFAEGLSDRQAADAVRSRIDWKYFLGLELRDAGWDHHSVICPMQHASHGWHERKDSQGKPVLKVEFSAHDCVPCPQRVHCTQNIKAELRWRTAP